MRVAKPLTALAVTLTALAMIAASAVSAQAVPYDPLRITVKAGDGGVGALRGRVLTAYKLADYVDGSFVSIDDRLLDGVAVETLPTLKTHAERVLAKTTGVSDVKTLPGWGEVADPTGWLGGFRQNAGSSQNQGEFGLGWNDSGPQGIGTNSPTRAYVGTVREFADNLVKDAAALSALKAGPKSAPVTWSSGNSLNLTVPSTGVYVVLDSAPKSTWQGSNSQGTTSNPADESSVTYSTGSSLPMIVPTKADDNDLASLNETPRTARASHPPASSASSSSRTSGMKRCSPRTPIALPPTPTTPPIRERASRTPRGNTPTARPSRNSWIPRPTPARTRLITPPIWATSSPMS
jgi:hypothetical protein